MEAKESKGGDHRVNAAEKSSEAQNTDSEACSLIKEVNSCIAKALSNRVAELMFTPKWILKQCEMEGKKTGIVYF